MLLSFFCNIFIYAQGNDDNKETFVKTITNSYSSCRDCDKCDYYVLFLGEYNGLKSNYIAMDDDLKLLIMVKDKVSLDSAIVDEKNKLISNTVFTINNNILTNILIFDIWDGDSIFNNLRNDKDKFLNYYFNTDSSYKYNVEDFVKSNNSLSLQNKIFKVTAIIKQLYEWHIPVYGCSNLGTIKYGYFDFNINKSTNSF